MKFVYSTPCRSLANISTEYYLYSFLGQNPLDFPGTPTRSVLHRWANRIYIIFCACLWTDTYGGNGKTKMYSTCTLFAPHGSGSRSEPWSALVCTICHALRLRTRVSPSSIPANRLSHLSRGCLLFVGFYLLCSTQCRLRTRSHICHALFLLSLSSDPYVKPWAKVGLILKSVEICFWSTDIILSDTMRVAI